MKKKKNGLLGLAVCIAFAGTAQPNCNVSETDSLSSLPTAATVAEEGAWCWFADPRALNYDSPDGKISMTYVGYIDRHGNICAKQYDHIARTQAEVLVRSYFQPDDHDNPTFMVLPDGRVMVFYSRHTDEPCFYYRVSSHPGDITTLGAEHRIPTDHNTTYPSPFFLAEDPEHFYLCWRGINWHPTIAQLELPGSNGETSVSWGPYQIVQSTGARPYAKYDCNGKDRIMLAFTTGHPDNEDPNWVYYGFVDINSKTLCDINGQELSRIADGPFSIDKTTNFAACHPSVVVDSAPCRDWLWQLSADSAGRPLIAFARISPDKARHDYFLARWDGNAWQRSFICNGGAAFHQSPGLEMCYSGGMAIDPRHPSDIYCSVPIKGEYGNAYEIVKHAVDGQGNVLNAEAVTRNSKKNNARPFVIPWIGCRQPKAEMPARLAWMRGDYYDWIVSSLHPEGFSTSIMANLEEFPERPPFMPDSDSGQPSKFDENVAFDFSIDCELADGVLVDLGDLEYCVDMATLTPEVRYKGKACRSSNMLATSDIWREKDRATDGKWHEPKPLGKFSLRLAYADGWLTTYINGRIDQHIDLAESSVTYH